MPLSKQTAADVVSSITVLQRTIRCATQKSLRPGEPGLALQAVLRYIRDHEPTRASDIADWIGIGAAPLSRHIADLEDSGHIRRSVDPADRRAQLITLTEAGRILIAEVWQRRIEQLQDALAGWDEGEARRAVETIERLEEALSAGLRVPRPSRVQEPALSS
jgi:DNA-binding MarR family transcriptional regulator